MPHLGELQAMVDEIAPSPQVSQTVVAASGDNVQMTANNLNGYIRIQSAGGVALASLSISHPPDSVSQNAQIRSIYFDCDVGAITWPNSSAMNLPSSAANGDSATTQRLEPGLWPRRY